MSGHHRFSELRKRMPSARRVRNARIARRILARMRRSEVRQTRVLRHPADS
jgi:hypothetical protein